MCRVTFFPGNTSVEVADGTTIFQAAVAAGVDIGGGCGGSGSCGKCKVIVDGPCEGGSQHITESEYSAGCRLGCTAAVKGDVFVLVSAVTGQPKIVSAHQNRAPADFSPLAASKCVKLSQPSIENSEADFERLKKALDIKDLTVQLYALNKLPEILRKNDWAADVVLYENEIIDVVPCGQKLYGLAVDVGTTTVAAEIIDLQSGEAVSGFSDYNHQIVCGDDVIARMMYEEEHGQQKLTELIVSTINEIICSFDKEIHAVCISGNTIMVHMLLGLPTKNIRFEPYVPVTNFPPVVKASDIGLNVIPAAPVYIVPGCAGYVGGDITAGVAAAGLIESSEPSLLIDVGTNGEVVLGCRDWLLTCSTSAGPSFEGGGISCGMRGISGAIDSVEVKNGQVKYTVIGNLSPSGICGSGVIDAAAQMFLSGKIDKKGCISEKITIAENVSLTEADIENIIRTKAAIFAGCCVLLDAVGMSFEDLESVCIAGGFGAYLNIENAQTIGLLPPLPDEKYKILGNAALSGAVLCLLSEKERRNVEKTAQAMTYVDLSSSNSFFEQYSSALFLPHTNTDLFQKKSAD